MLNGRLQTQRLRKRLDDAYDRYPLVGTDPEVQSDFARYLCVLTSGYVEQAVYILFLEYSREGTKQRVFRYVTSNLEWFMNPSAEKIANLLGSFDPVWREEFETLIEGQRKEALNSVVALRHAIAHGENAGITYRRLNELRPSVYDIVDWLVEQLAT